MAAVKRLTDPTFRYVPAASTNIRKTFERVRREMKEQKEKNEAIPFDLHRLRSSGR